MKPRLARAGLLAGSFAMYVGAVCAQEAGLTGDKHAGDVVLARQLLMTEVEANMMAIDFALGGRETFLKTLRDNAYTISSLLSAFTHLFPPQTKPGAPLANDWPTPTAASIKIWEDFEAFYETTQAAANIALDASKAANMDAFKTAGAKLRAACDSCHARYTTSQDAPKP